MYSNWKITAPVSVNDVQRAIGSSSTDVGTLCSHPNVNKWARYRPIEYRPSGINFLGILTEAQRASVNYGITDIPTWASKSIGRMLNYWFGVDTALSNAPECGVKVTYWNNLPPTSVYRLTDFVANPNDYTARGYYASAEVPIGGLASSTLTITPDGIVTIIFTKNEGGVSEGLTVKYEDLTFPGINNFSFANMYFGVAIYKGGTFYVMTQDTPMSSFQEMGASVRLSVSDSALTGSAQVFPFISSVAITSLTTTTTMQGNFIALQEPESLTVAVKYAQITIRNFYVWRNPSESARLVYYSFRLTNTESDNSRSYSAVITFFRSDRVTELYTKTVTGTISVGASTIVEGSQDMTSYGGASLVGSARVVVTVSDSSVVFKISSSAVTNDIPDTEPIIK